MGLTKEKLQKPVSDTDHNEEEYLFDKHYICPVCEYRFLSKTVKTGKVRLIGHDSDLRPRYREIDALKYDVVVCPKCGFGAITRFFTALSPTQRKWVQEQISSVFKGLKEPEEVYSYAEAIHRHKLALMSAVVKRGKVSERAYCCLKIAWLLRAQREEEPDAEKRNALREEEMDMLKKACDGFEEAFSTERFPMCGMDEITVTYMVADLCRQLQDYDTALRWVSKVILSHSANERIKDKARTLRDQIKESCAEIS